MMYVEKSFLGCLIKAGYLIQSTVIRPEYLQETRHQILMKRMIELNQAGKPIDFILLTTIPELKMIGGISYLNELESCAEIEKFDELEDVIIEDWKEREKQNILQIASINDWEIHTVIEKLNEISEVKLDDCTSLSEALVDLYELPWNDPEPMHSVSTGIRHLDALTGGFQKGEVTIIAARPSMGKTDVMLHFAKIAGWSGFLPLIFSLEMPEKLITKRLIASTGGFNRAKLRNPKRLLTEKQKAKWADILGKLSKTNIQIFDKSGQTIPEMRAKIRKMLHLYPDKKPIVFIDYLTLIRTTDSFGGNSHLQVTEISKSLKMMAKEFDIPVVCLAQLNRSVETRGDKRPTMSDIRESGSIEQDADVILLLYREQYYNRLSMNDTLEMIVGKNRNGPVGSISVKYNMYTGKIEEIQKEESTMQKASVI